MRNGGPEMLLVRIVLLGVALSGAALAQTLPDRSGGPRLAQGTAPGATPSPAPTSADNGSGLVKSPAPAPQTEIGLERLPLGEAVRRSLARNPTAVVAAQEIARAEALVREARSGSLPILTANGTYTRLDDDRTFSGRVIAARDQISGNVQLIVPVVAAQRWVQWSHASTNVDVTRANTVEVRRQVALATARAYLAVVAQKRQVDINERALATARAHAEFAHTRFTGGVGNRVDDVRAAQQLATTQSQLASSYTALARAREALGVMAGEERPVDADADVRLPQPPSGAALDEAQAERTDIVAARKRLGAAEQVRKDSWADYMPSLTGQFQPFYQNPASLVNPQTGWQALLVLSIPIYDGGLRYGQKDERAALVEQAKAQYDGLVRQSKSDVRTAAEAAKRADEALASAIDAAQLAHQALDLTSLAYQAGARTNIEVIDAERQARDADTAAAIAEDAVRQARLDLLAAAGRFPGESS
jgi:outer membrane protein